MFDKNVKLDIPCPECNHTVKLSIREIERNPSYACPGCQNTINLDASKLTKELGKAEKQIKDMFKKFK